MTLNADFGIICSNKNLLTMRNIDIVRKSQLLDDDSEQGRLKSMLTSMPMKHWSPKTGLKKNSRLRLLYRFFFPGKWFCVSVVDVCASFL